jgi:hypothetical protein
MSFQKQWGEASLQTMDRFHFLPSSVHSSKFRIPQVLYLPFLRKHGGCGGILPVLGHADVQTFRRADVSLSPFLSNSCELFCAPQKLNSFLFKQFCTLSQKPPVGGGIPGALAWRGGLAMQESSGGNLKVSQAGAGCRLLRQLREGAGRSTNGGVVTRWIHKGEG